MVLSAPKRLMTIEKPTVHQAFPAPPNSSLARPMTDDAGLGLPFAMAKLFSWFLSGSGLVGRSHATKAATRAPSKALPRRRALCTNWKKLR